MTADTPRPDPKRFAAVPPDLVVLVNLVADARARTAAQVATALKVVLPAESVRTVLDGLRSAGSLTGDGKLALTAKGREAAAGALGRGTRQPWPKVLSQRLPMLALGADADDPALAACLARPDAFKAAVIAVGFGVPNERAATTLAVGGELVWRVLKASMPALVGQGPFPAIKKLAAVEGAILAGLAGKAGGRLGSLPAILDDLAAASLGLPKKVGVAELRRQVVRAGVAAAGAARTRDPAPSAQPTGGDFASRVAKVAASLSTPPFQDRVAIAQLYDAFGRSEPDAGSLASFKQRLLAASAKRLLDLARLDLPEVLDRSLRDRSEMAIGSDVVHFVLTRTRR